MNLRLAAPEDEPLLARAYASAHSTELGLVDWSDDEKQAFCTKQLATQLAHLHEQRPNARQLVVEVDGVDVGRLVLDDEPDATYLQDIALVPEARGQGIGTQVVRDLQAQGPIRLHAARGSLAEQLYGRLGFSEVGGDELTVELEWRAAS